MRARTLVDLKRLPQDRTGRVERETLWGLGWPMPDEVLKQFVWDHGLDRRFQQLYGKIDWTEVRWTKQPLPAADIVTASEHPECADWSRRVERRVERFESEGWRCIDSRPDVWKHWERSGSWRTPPVLIDATLLGRQPRLHLIEGHTRLGILRALVGRALIDDSTLHQVWLGTPNRIDLGPDAEFLLAADKAAGR